MIDYLHNYNMEVNTNNYFMMTTGDTYEAPLYTGKQAFVAAVNTMQNNHPNDWFIDNLLIAGRDISGSTSRRSICVWSPLGTNYNYATSALLFPFSTINADGSSNNTEVTPYDKDPATGAIPSANFVDTPRAGRRYLLRHGPDAGLQPVCRHADVGHHSEDLRDSIRPSPSPPGWRAAWDAKARRRSSSSKPTAWPTATPPPA